MATARSKPVVHLELHTGDLARASALYAELCGWRPEVIEAGSGSYTALRLGNGVGGGVRGGPAPPAVGVGGGGGGGGRGGPRQGPPAAAAFPPRCPPEPPG